MHCQIYTNKTPRNHHRHKYSLSKKQQTFARTRTGHHIEPTGFSQSREGSQNGRGNAKSRSVMLQKPLSECSLKQQSRWHDQSREVLRYNHTLSTAPSFENPFVHRPNNQKNTSIVASQFNGRMANEPYLTADYYRPEVVYDNNDYKLSRPSQINQQNHQQQLAAYHYLRVFSNNSGIPFQQQSHRVAKQTQHKLSLKSVKQTHRHVKPQILFYLKYQHLQSNINIHNNQQNTEEFGLSDHYNHISNYNTLVAQFGCINPDTSQQLGCKCMPKCRWINKWLNSIHSHSISQNRSLLSVRPPSAILQNYYAQIQKDVNRTYPLSLSFKRQELINSLRYVLAQYAKVDIEVGYVQGMNFIAATLAYHATSHQDALAIMIHIMKTLNFRYIYLGALSYVQIISSALSLELRRLSYDLYRHLMNQAIDFELFIRSWYFSMFGSFVPLPFMQLVVEKFVNRQMAGLNEIILAVLIYLKDGLMSLRGSELQMCFTNHSMEQFSKQIDWNELISKSYHLNFQKLHF